MLQRRRIFDETNSILNYAFLVHCLIGLLYFSSFWISLKPQFIDYIVLIGNVLGWLISGSSLILFVWGLIIHFVDKSVKWHSLVWDVMRILISMLLSIGISALSIVVSNGVVISL